jgi:hypothetical protein
VLETVIIEIAEALLQENTLRTHYATSVIWMIGQLNIRYY